MRTRLDEIVCEEMLFSTGFAYDRTEGNSVYPIGGDQLKRIAERAFRHGDEQHHRTCCLGGHSPVVQPAPAEDEEHKRWMCWPLDRRKGERRKGYESQALLYTDPKATGIYCILDTHWLVDRRTGKDRRK